MIFFRYQILAAAAIPSGFVDGKVAVEKLLEALQLDESEYKVGTTKVYHYIIFSLFSLYPPLGKIKDLRRKR